MIKARLSDTGLLIGLSAENLKRLQLGQPIKFDLSAVGLPAGPCILLFGETEEAIAKDLADGGFLPAMNDIKGRA
jgi:hypothetical protein